MALDLNALEEDLVEDEQLRLVVYDDATGQPLRPGMVLKGHATIGIGRALDVHGISKEEARYLCRNDIGEVAEQLHQVLPWFGNLDGLRQRVLANMAFNLGIAGLLAFHRMLSFVENHDYENAAREMLMSKWAKQVGDRAIRLAQWMRTGNER